MEMTPSEIVSTVMAICVIAAAKGRAQRFTDEAFLEEARKSTVRVTTEGLRKLTEAMQALGLLVIQTEPERSFQVTETGQALGRIIISAGASHAHA